MKNQLRKNKLSLHKETIRSLNQIELADVVGGSVLTPPATRFNCPTVRICVTTPNTGA